MSGGAVDAFGDAKNEEAQLEQKARHENAHEKRHDATDQIDQTLRWGLLHPDYDANNHGDSTAEKGDDVKEFYETAKNGVVEREVKKPSKEVFFVRHAASWLEIREQGWS
jgi:hypothetical protein